MLQRAGKQETTQQLVLNFDGLGLN